METQNERFCEVFSALKMKVFTMSFFQLQLQTSQGSKFKFLLQQNFLPCIKSLQGEFKPRA